MKRCRVCLGKFEPRFSSMEPVCQDIGCAIAWGKSKAGKQHAEKVRKKSYAEDKREYRARDKGRQEKSARFWCHKYIKVRDQAAGALCITCGSTLSYGIAKQHGGTGVDAGHFIPSGRGSLIRFCEANIHSQCVHCNRHRSGRVDVYKDVMVERYGADVVDALERMGKIVHTWTIEELVWIQGYYKAKIKELEEIA